MKMTSSLVVFAAGLVLAAAGLYLIYPPAALIVSGLILMGIAVFGDRRP